MVIDSLYIIFYTILGAAFGSFICAIVERFHEGKSLTENSKCNNCNVKINWFDNIPIISYLILKGKCRNCHKAYPITTFISELVGAIIGLLVSLTYLNTSEIYNINLFESIVIFSLLLSLWFISLYDIIYYELDTSFTGLLILFTSIYLVVNNFNNYDFLFERAISGILCALFFLAFAYFTHEKLGYGDSFLGFLTGILCGYSGTIISINIMIGGSLLVGTLIYFYNRLQLKKEIDFMTIKVPLVPFFCLGILLTNYLFVNVHLF